MFVQSMLMCTRTVQACWTVVLQADTKYDVVQHYAHQVQMQCRLSSR